MRAKSHVSKIDIVNLDKAVKELKDEIVVRNGNIVLIEIEGRMYIFKVIVNQDDSEDVIDIYSFISLDEDRIYKISVYKESEYVFVGGNYISELGVAFRIEGICDISIGIDNIIR